MEGQNAKFITCIAELIANDMRKGDEASLREHLSGTFDSGASGAFLVMSIIEDLGKSGRDDLMRRVTQIIEEMVK